MKKIRIGLVIISCVKWGGAEEVVYQLVKNFGKLDLDISIFVNNELSECYRNIKGVSVYRIGPINQRNRWTILYSYLKIRSRLFRYLLSRPVDLIHAHLNGSLVACFGLSKKFGIPIVFTLHGIEIKNYFERKSLLDYWLLINMFRNSKVITSPSRWQIERLEEKYKVKTVIVANGVDTTTFKPIAFKRENNVVLYVGRFDRMKGVCELVEAAKSLPSYEFWFIGWGPLARIIDLPNTKNLGFKNRSEIVELNNKATICCFPSHHESFGISGLEAMACGKPIICTKLGYSEFVNNGIDGEIIEAKNAIELKTMIDKLMTNSKLRKSLGERAREKSLKYDWKKISGKYYRLYLDAITK